MQPVMALVGMTMSISVNQNSGSMASQPVVSPTSPQPPTPSSLFHLSSSAFMLELLAFILRIDLHTTTSSSFFFFFSFDSAFEIFAPCFAWFLLSCVSQHSEEQMVQVQVRKYLLFPRNRHLSRHQVSIPTQPAHLSNLPQPSYLHDQPPKLFA